MSPLWDGSVLSRDNRVGVWGSPLKAEATFSSCNLRWDTAILIEHPTDISKTNNDIQLCSQIQDLSEYIFPAYGLRVSGNKQAASPKGLVHSDLLTGIGQSAVWHLSQQSLLSKHGIDHCSSQKDGTYLMGGQKHLLLPYAGNCQGLFTPRLVTFGARKQAFPRACQKKYK